MLGENIRKHRKAKKMSVNLLSKLSLVSLGYISDLENNKVNNPTMDKLNKIATALGISVSELLSSEEKLDLIRETINEYNQSKSKESYIEEIQFDAEINLLMKKIKKLSEKDRKVVEVLVSQLLKEE